MEKSVRILSILLASIFLINFIIAVDCPKGIENDPYPGSCGLYTDTNNNGFCDLGEEQINSQIQTTYETPEYNFILITIISIIIYLGSYFYFKDDLILHKKVWNVLLLITFIITALTSIVYLFKLDLQVNFGISMAFISFWHIEIGLVMTIISIFHALWHLTYFKYAFKKN